MPDSSRRLPLAATSEAVLASEIAQLRREVDDLRSTTTARRGFAALPIGLPFPWFGGSIPIDCIVLQGQAISRADNPVLFAMWGTTHGAGNSSTTFNVPDAQNRAIIGVSGTKALGAKGGAETHTLSVAEMPGHNHGGATNGALVSFVRVVGAVGTVFEANHAVGRAAGAFVDYMNVPTAPDHTHTINGQGGGGAHNNMPPWIAANWIVRSG